MSAFSLAALALAFAALASLLAGVTLWKRHLTGRRSARMLADVLGQRASQAQAAAMRAASSANAGANANTSTTGAVHGATQRDADASAQVASPHPLLERASRAGMRWLDSPLGRHVVADEDRRLLEQCGFVDARARGLFLFARIGGALLLPLAALALMGFELHGPRAPAVVVIALLAGFMLPKIAVQRRATARRAAVVDELPMLVDLLRLLQGVGLSLDQSLQVMVNDFRGVLPVLSGELAIAQRQAAAGRTREQSLQRLASSYANEDLRAIVRLLIQVDRHGGAVQEPLRQFGDRLREARRSMLRERIGRLTVKMTGVMVVTLLPALLIVTAGPGVLAVVHSLAASSAVHR
ncbi:Type II secretion system F domain protein [Paraburkholderia piptadeniae]|uniref:Type II secretion system F domain protein n=1 Tax=Paraburkholderia piptadeniae TaxID=1701573 RepID=A0A1N7RMX5_9BURK|nr:type II secretion system F family protein [Paraburkholderia piptadeniae]SIT36469.1 Type II secretion system F domain protein [Paraburkholderia piptadeniae]